MENGIPFFKKRRTRPEVNVIKDGGSVPENVVSVVVPGAEILMPLDELVDVQRDRET